MKFSTRRVSFRDNGAIPPDEPRSWVVDAEDLTLSLLDCESGKDFLFLFDEAAELCDVLNHYFSDLELCKCGDKLVKE